MAFPHYHFINRIQPSSIVDLSKIFELLKHTFMTNDVRFMETGNVFCVDMSSQVHNLCLVSRILKHNRILAV